MSTKLYCLLLPVMYFFTVNKANGLQEQGCGVQEIQPLTDWNRPKRMLIKPGSKESIPHSWPWVVNIYVAFPFKFRNGTQVTRWYRCGGSLIKTFSEKESDIVLSAAHCFRECGYESEHFCRFVEPTNIRVVLGDHNRTKNESETGEENFFVTSNISQHYKIHYQYQKGDDNADLTILKLEKPVQFSKTIRPICLHDGNGDSRSNCMVAGWGAPLFGRSELAPHNLHEMPIDVHNDNYCAERVKERPNYYESSKTICAGYGESQGTVCSGDSGGPLMCKNNNGLWTLDGVVSRGGSDNCTHPIHPQLFVRVSYYYPWIMNTIKELAARG